MEERNFKLPEKLTMGYTNEARPETRERTSRFSDKPITGRRGVATLKKSNKILKEKIKSKERLQKLASKYTEEYMTGKQIRESGLFRNDMLY